MDFDADDDFDFPPREIRAAETVTFRRSHFYAAIAPIAFVVGLAAGYVLWGRDQGQAPAPTAAIADSAPVADQPAPAGATRYEVSTDDDPAIGNVGAPVTIIEFSDFECPFCSRFHEDTFRAILERYPEQVLFVYRDFPLTSIHSNAQRAAEAAQCAHEQGRYWEFHDLLFRNQEHLGDPELYAEAASALSIDVDSFNDCVADRRYAEEVTADFDAARALGLTGTPTFFINGRPVVGAQPLEVFVEIIEEELAALDQ